MTRRQKKTLNIGNSVYSSLSLSTEPMLQHGAFAARGALTHMTNPKSLALIVIKDPIALFFRSEDVSPNLATYNLPSQMLPVVSV